MKNSPPDRHRVSLDITRKEKSLVDGLAKRSGDISTAELFRRMTALYANFLDHHEAKGRVVFRHEGGAEEVIRFVF